ncbi:MAG: hypothetical protein WC602_02145 [archaeon]
MVWQNPYEATGFLFGIELAFIVIGLLACFLLSRNKKGALSHYLKIFVLFMVSYNVLYLVSQTGLIYRFDSPMLFVFPIIGFFFTYLITEFASNYFESNLKTNVYFPLLFLILCFVAYWLQLYVYIGNMSFLSGGQLIPFDFFSELRNSPFLVFVLAGLLGWVSAFAVEKTKKVQ